MTQEKKGVLTMICIDNRYGTIEISQEYFRYLIGYAPMPTTACMCAARAIGWSSICISP